MVLLTLYTHVQFNIGQHVTITAGMNVKDYSIHSALKACHIYKTAKNESQSFGWMCQTIVSLFQLVRKSSGRMMTMNVYCVGVAWWQIRLVLHQAASIVYLFNIFLLAVMLLLELVITNSNRSNDKWFICMFQRQLQLQALLARIVILVCIQIWLVLWNGVYLNLTFDLSSLGSFHIVAMYYKIGYPVVTLDAIM